MLTLTALPALIAASGRGDDPGGVGGVLIIIGIILAVVLLAALGVVLVLKRGARMR
jgi:hypothetical protein